jgi:acyl-CoA-dependent ceramide synthase
MRPGGEFETIGPYELNWVTQQYKCLLSQVITSGLLGMLQAVNIFWYFLILRIALRLVFKGDKKDDRSDSEEEEDEDEADVGSEQESGPMPLKPTLLVNGDPLDVNEASSTGLTSRDGAGAIRQR